MGNTPGKTETDRNKRASKGGIDDAISSSIATLVGEDLSRKYGKNAKWWGTVELLDGCVVGIPFNARHVIIYNPKDQSVTPIGHDLGDGRDKWWGGVLVKDRYIYAFPNRETSMLKIDVLTKTVTKLPSPLFASSHGWKEGVVGIDGNIYAFPRSANFMLKVDTINDVISTVGNDFGPGNYKYLGTVKANNGLLYGIPGDTKRITKYDPATDTTSLVGHEAEEDFNCIGNGALAANGNIYAMTEDGKILEIDVANNTHSFIATAPLSIYRGWYGAITGQDGNIYFIPFNASHVLMYDLATNTVSLVGNDLGNEYGKWLGGAKTSTDGLIHCLPHNADQILSINTNPSVPPTGHDSVLLPDERTLTDSPDKGIISTDTKNPPDLLPHLMKKRRRGNSGPPTGHDSVLLPDERTLTDSPDKGIVSTDTKNPRDLLSKSMKKSQESFIKLGSADLLTSAEISTQSGQMNLLRNQELITIAIDGLQEVEKDGENVFHHDTIGLNNPFSILSQEDTIPEDKDKEVIVSEDLDGTASIGDEDEEATGDSISFQTDIGNGGKLQVDAILVGSMGRVGTGNAIWHAFPGDFKFSFQLSGWNWRNDQSTSKGNAEAFLDVHVEVATTVGKVYPTISDRTYTLGTSECLLELTNEYFEFDDGSPTGKTKRMPEGFPKLTLRKDGKQIFIFRFPRFEGKVFYDPFIWWKCTRCDTFNIRPARDEENHCLDIFFGYDCALTIHDYFEAVISEAKSDSSILDRDWHKYQVVGDKIVWLNNASMKRYTIKQILKRVNPRKERDHIKVLLHERSVPRPAPNPPAPPPTNSVPVVPSFPYDVFLSHTWAEDEDRRNTHERVKLVKEALNRRGISTWFDEEQMQGNVYDRMARGIEESLTVAVFVTRKYHDKVGRDGNDNCKFELNHAIRQRTVDNMIPVVMEDLPSGWTGTLGLTLGSHLYYSFKTDPELDQCVNDLESQINERRRNAP